MRATLALNGSKNQQQSIRDVFKKKFSKKVCKIYGHAPVIKSVKVIFIFSTLLKTIR